MTKALPREPLDRHATAMNLQFGRLRPNFCYHCNILLLSRNQLHLPLQSVHHFVDERLLSPTHITTNS